MNHVITSDDHRRVLEQCVDVPGQRPVFAAPLGAVGIANKTVWVDLPQGRLAFAVRLEVDLPGHLRGIHMSRMEEVVSQLHGRKFVDPREYAEELGRLVILRQEATAGSVHLSGEIPVARTTRISGRTSIDAVEIMVRVDLSRTGEQVATRATLGAGLHHITACPCTQAYNSVLYGQKSEPCPQPTHSQRSRTWLEIGPVAMRLHHDDLLACLEAALHVTSDLLKRSDEADLVLRAHCYPQFAEDAVRETAREVLRLLGGILPEGTELLIESTSLESIHIHDVICRMTTTMGQLAAIAP